MVPPTLKAWGLQGAFHQRVGSSGAVFRVLPTTPTLWEAQTVKDKSHRFLGSFSVRQAGMIALAL